VRNYFETQKSLQKTPHFINSNTETPRRLLRDTRHALFLQRSEAQKVTRRQYWNNRAIVEVATILSIAWYLKMELFRTEKLPQSMTPSLIRMVPALEQDVFRQAQDVYNKIYRDSDDSEFMIFDDTQQRLHKCFGKIQCYNKARVGYDAIVYLDKTGMSGVPMLVKSEDMEPVVKRWNRLSHYNSKPKMATCTATMNNFFVQDPNAIITVCFRHSVFHQLTILFDNRLEEHTDNAYNRMKSRLDAIDAIERGEQKAIERERVRYKEAAVTVITPSKPPRKRRRVFKSMSTINLEEQKNAVWTAKIDHIRSLIEEGQDDPHETLFSFPFRTVDESLIKCVEEISIFDKYKPSDRNSDDILTSTSSVEPIIITTSAVRSLSPGTDIDDDVIDLCIKWYVDMEGFFQCPKIPLQLTYFASTVLRL
jgi:hypothetical protein